MEPEDRDGPADDMGQQGVIVKGTVDPAGLRAMPQGPRQAGCTVWYSFQACLVSWD